MNRTDPDRQRRLRQAASGAVPDFVFEAPQSTFKTSQKSSLSTDEQAKVQDLLSFLKEGKEQGTLYARPDRVKQYYETVSKMGLGGMEKSMLNQSTDALPTSSLTAPIAPRTWVNNFSTCVTKKRGSWDECNEQYVPNEYQSDFVSLSKYHGQDAPIPSMYQDSSVKDSLGEQIACLDRSLLKPLKAPDYMFNAFAWLGAQTRWGDTHQVLARNINESIAKLMKSRAEDAAFEIYDSAVNEFTKVHDGDRNPKDFIVEFLLHRVRPDLIYFIENSKAFTDTIYKAAYLLYNLERYLAQKLTI